MVGRGFRVVLCGRPNAGKSSLFNALCKAVALVSSQPGTTRDYLTATLELGEIRCQLVDTAGVDTGRSRGAVTSIYGPQYRITAT